MTRHETFPVTLSEDTVAVIREAVASGRFGSESEVVQEALRLWSERERAGLDRAAAEVRRLWDEGLASGPAVDGEEALARVGSRLESRIAARAEP